MKDFLTVTFWEQFMLVDVESLKKYLDLIQNATVKDGEYKELHHIVPKSFDESLMQEPTNLVWLRGKDHFEVHKLLSQCFDGVYKQKMMYAFHMMCYNKTSNRYDITKEDYELARQQLSEEFILNNPAKREDVKKKIAKGGMKRTGKNNGNYGGLSEENKKHLSESRIASGIAKGEKNPMFGKHHTEETKRKMSEKKIGHTYLRGIPKSEEHKRHLSESHKKNVTEESRKRSSEINKNYIWITNGIEDLRVTKDTTIPIGYRRGRVNNLFGKRNSTTIENTTNEKNIG